MSVRSFAATVEMPVAPEIAFDYLADPRNRPQWQSSLRSVGPIDAGEPRVGMRWRETTVVGVRPRLEITEHSPYAVWSERGTWRGVSATLRLRFDPVETGGVGCVVQGRGEVRGSGPWAVPATLAGLLAGAAVAADLRRAAGLLAVRETRG